MKRLSPWVLAATAVVLVACGTSAPTPDLAAEEKAIRDLSKHWLELAKARDAAGEAGLFAADAIAYRAHHGPIVGPAEYQTYAAKDYADNPKASTTWSTDAIRVAESGDLAIQTGEFHNTALGPKGDREDKGRFVTVWRKTNGEWKVAHDIGSTTMPEVQAEKKQ